MNTIYSLLGQYWGIVTIVVAGLLYFGVDKTARKTAIKFAEKKAMTLMFGIEKKCEDFALQSGKDKFDWVVEKGYDLLPAPVRLIISPALFKTIVQGLHDDAVKFVTSKKDATINVTPTAS